MLESFHWFANCVPLLSTLFKLHQTISWKMLLEFYWTVTLWIRIKEEKFQQMLISEMFRFELVSLNVRFQSLVPTDWLIDFISFALYETRDNDKYNSVSWPKNNCAISHALINENRKITISLSTSKCLWIYLMSIC